MIQSVLGVQKIRVQFITVNGSLTSLHTINKIYVLSTMIAKCTLENFPQENVTSRIYIYSKDIYI